MCTLLVVWKLKSVSLSDVFMYFSSYTFVDIYEYDYKCVCVHSGVFPLFFSSYLLYLFHMFHSLYVFSYIPLVCANVCSVKIGFWLLVLMLVSFLLNEINMLSEVFFPSSYYNKMQPQQKHQHKTTKKKQNTSHTEKISTNHVERERERAT